VDNKDARPRRAGSDWMLLRLEWPSACLPADPHRSTLSGRGGDAAGKNL
jgi:hypothetical protein